MRRIRALLVAATLTLGAVTTQADLRTPVWYDQNAVSTAPDWHYRVPVNIPAGTPVNSTLKVDVDFVALLTQLGISGTFDVNSPRVVRSTGALSTNQQYTDTVYANATDASGNSRGEVRFISEDAGAATYYLYFDITANGAKAANPQTPINGNFEFGGSGNSTPPGWNAPTISSAGADAQIRPSETVNVNTTPATADSPRNTDGAPRTGAFSYLIGYRSAATMAAGNPAVTLTKTIAVPAASPGNITLNWRPEGWDSSANGSAANIYDTLSVRVIGASTTELVGSVTAQNYVTRPFSPNLGTVAASATQSGFRQYNGYDCDTNGTHRSGMTVPCKSEPWWTYTASLAAFAGQTITLNIRFFSDGTNDRTWFHIDDIEWSVVNATLGTAEGFGVNITVPTAATTYTAGQRLVIRAQIDAAATAAAAPVTANLYDNGGTLVTSGMVLYNDGTHGDVTANDALWSNDGSVVANPTYTFIGGVISGSNWRVRVFAKDASTSTLGASNGLIHVNGQANSPETQTTFHNIDEQTFTVQVPLLLVSKVSEVLSDPINNATNPKRIPGAVIRYIVTVTNTGPGTVDASTLAITDPVPANTRFCVSTLCSSPIVEFVDGSPASGLSFNYAANVSYSNIAGGGAPFTYPPVPDAEGFDAVVTGVRIAPTGSMAGAGAGNPSFVIRFRVKVN